MRFASLPWSLQALVYASIATADSLPYNPTRILTTTNSSYRYLFQTSSQSTYQGLLRAIDITKSFATDQLAISTITNGLPFLRDDRLVPYTPTIDSWGNITVIAGSCTAGANKTEVWTYCPASANTPALGTWSQHQTSDQSLSPGSNLTGSNYLASAVAFSPKVDGDPTDLAFYMFGGMCPFTTGDAHSWARDAAYSNMMLQLSPDPANAASGSYSITSIANRGSAIAEAGYTMTGLTPTFSVNATGQPNTQQQDFVLIGGHTQQAFINMSNIALFSLPQESWAYLPVRQPSSVKTDLAARQSNTDVEPRSGHTAVLSEDGSKVIVCGGWVGDITNAAVPQLAVLHLGSEYGGSASLEWTWSVPTANGNFTPPGDGLYGHGATMLPGGIMMVVGGYAISGSSSKRASQTTSDSVYLFNTTSNTWIDSYTPPSKPAEADQSSTGPLSKTSQQAGLGIGLAVGAAALAGLIWFYFWYSKRLRKQREERARELLGEGKTSHVSVVRIDRPSSYTGGIDGRGSYIDANRPCPSMSEAGATGLFVDIPSPTRGLRKALPNRGYAYHQAPRGDESRANRGSGSIHPIFESADEDSIRGDDDRVDESDAVQKVRQMEQVLDRTPQEQDPERNLRELQRILKASDTASRPARDPFIDPEPNPLGSHPVSPQIPETMRPVPPGRGRGDSPTRRPLSAEMDGSMNWMIVEQAIEPSDPSGSSTGRTSPTKTDDRTSSSLSEQSQPSQISSNSMTRTMSTRTGALLSAAAALQGDADDHEIEERTSTMGTLSSLGGRQSPYYFYTSTRPANEGKQKQRESYYAAQKSADSFTTARSTFAQLQDEGAALLGGPPMADRDDPYQRAMAAASPQVGRRQSMRDELPPIVISPRRRQGWMGSLKRALTAMSNDRSFSFTASAVEQLDRPADAADKEPRTCSSSPIRKRNPDGPRRAVSEGGTLLRQKRGQQDWEKDKEFSPYRDDPDPGDWGAPELERRPSDAENEWDVEGAAGQRDVQIMFTVPKARLRVVNADVERASMRSASDSAVSRTGSMGREASVRSSGSGGGSGGGRERRTGALGITDEEEEGIGVSTARDDGLRSR
ncbi:hypothetical protein DOTSEDRAFT_72128 [Lecanosticta acicola]|uniref:Galactose oxidase n=1 Tax=Lecanosticta acicola TaxID=111012 RepID=A0AAI8YYS3_9PEZI|nr:hypothetical protein DOTSEDRAFT_72128 [Lecanosticta acicola]